MLQAEQVLQERYQLQRQLGRTAAGRQTWLALDLLSNQQVIVKLLAFNPQMEWDELKLFEREAQVLQALDHPRIPCYRDSFSLDQQTGGEISWFGLVQDYIPGFSLQELLERGKRFTEKQVREIATQVLNILIYLHELSPPVLHRDIKPSNLILGEYQQVYLVDFGAVQAQAAVTGVSFTVVGTSGYAPLEQFWGRAVAASDLYALGATLIHLLTGVAPADLPQKDSRIQFRDLVSLNLSLVSWIETMTEIAIEKRYTTARKALAALESGLVKPTTTETPNLSIFSKPADTSIQINRSVDKLLIYSPSTYLDLGEKYPVLHLVARVCLVCGLLLSFATRSLLLLIILIFLIRFACESLTIAKTAITICLDRKYLEVTKETNNWLAYTFGEEYGQIRIDLTKTQAVFLSQEGKLKTYTANIQAEGHIYPLLRGLSEGEGAWLVAEIQDWLNYLRTG